MQEITPEFVKTAITNTHPNQSLTMKLAKALRTHADGLIPTELIDKRRPSEPEAIKDYRKSIYVPMTKNPIQKVINSLCKIRRSQDWNIDHESEIPSTIAEGESLEDYCEKNYPGFQSITNWAFSDLLKQYLIDANSVVAIIPKRAPANSAEYIKPVAEVFTSDQVIYIDEEEEYCVLLSADKNVYKNPNGRKTFTGNIYYILTTTQVVRYKQGASNILELDIDYTHDIGEVPAFRVGGLFHKRVNNQTIYESRISAMIPNLDEAAREYSDLQAEIVQHIHSEKYAYTNTECPTCRGTGSVRVDGKEVKCSNCNGVGHVQSVSPFGVTLVSAAALGEHQLPTPPIGYINKDVEIAKLQDQRVQDHIYRALSSLNMEFLAQSPLNQSGTAKEVDKDELNNFVNSIAEDIVKILDRVYYFICEYRYKISVPKKDDRLQLLPKIAVPEKFDLLNSQYLMEEVKTAKDAGVSPSVLKHLQIDYARKKFNSDPDKAKEVEAVFELDPLFGYSHDDKLAMLSANGITMRDYVISCNINQLVAQCVDKDEQFFDLKFEAKKKIVIELADDIIKANSTVETIKSQLNNGQAQ